MAVRVLTAVTGAPWESTLVTALEKDATGVSVVRRCVDVADLLAAAATGQARAVLLSADLRRLDRDVLARLAAAYVAVLGVVSGGDEEAERHLRQLGVRHIVPAEASPGDMAAAIRRAVEAEPDANQGRSFADPGGPGQQVASLPLASSWLTETADEPLDPGSGQLVAVWGPTGAPGRTTVAVTLAAEIAALGRSTLLADADTYGGVVAQVLGLLDEAPGLAAAARAANHGQLDVPGLARHARQVTPTLRVLTGIARPDRWPELRPAALEVVWALARTLVEMTIVDCGFSLEQDEELSFDTAAPRRNGATLVTLDRADLIVVVGSADPVGLQRLVRALADLRETVPGARVQVLVNRLRRGPIAGPAEEQVREALDRYAAVRDPVFVPYDRSACDRALAAGRSLTEAAADSSARKALAAVAAQLVGSAAGAATPTRIARRRAAGRITLGS